MSKVLWNNEMDYCVGLITEMDAEEFESEATRTHMELTGDILHPEDYKVTYIQKHFIWVLEVL